MKTRTIMLTAFGVLTAGMLGIVAFRTEPVPVDIAPVQRAPMQVTVDVEMLESRGPPQPVSMEDIVRQSVDKLSNPSAEVRQACLELLAREPAALRSAADAITALLEDPVWHVRRAAVVAVGRLACDEGKGASACTRLVARFHLQPVRAHGSKAVADASHVRCVAHQALQERTGVQWTKMILALSPCHSCTPASNPALLLRACYLTVACVHTRSQINDTRALLTPTTSCCLFHDCLTGCLSVLTVVSVCDRVEI